MRLTEEEIRQIVKEEFNNLINEDEIDEKLLSALKGIGKGLYNKAADFMSGKPRPNASGGVAPYFAYSKIPQKQPMAQPEPEIQPGTGMTVRDPAQGMQISDPDAEQPSDYKDAPFGSSYSVNQPKQLGTGEPAAPQDFQPFGQLPPPEEIKKQLLLSEPVKIGITDKVGVLLSDTQSESFNLLLQQKSQAFRASEDYQKLQPQQKQQLDGYINTVLKSLTNTGRILLNPTFTTMGENFEDQRAPSARQVEKGIGVFDSYIVKTLIHSIKQKLSNIPDIIIEFVINSLHNEGRLAISRRMYNNLKHTDDARLKDLNQENVQESKCYNNFYNNWKRYTKPGVKI